MLRLEGCLCLWDPLPCWIREKHLRSRRCEDKKMDHENVKSCRGEDVVASRRRELWLKLALESIQLYMQVYSIILHLISPFLIFTPDKTLNFATGISTLIIILPYLSPSICLATCSPSWLSADDSRGMKLASLAALQDFPYTRYHIVL